MSVKLTPRFTVITLGVSDMRRSIAFYTALGFERRMKVTGDEVAFFDTGGTVIGLWTWDLLGEDTTLKGAQQDSFRGVTLAWNCSDRAEVDAVLAFAADQGAKLLRSGEATDYGGYRGYFADPDGHVWEAVVAPGIAVGPDRRVHLPD